MEGRGPKLKEMIVETIEGSFPRSEVVDMVMVKLIHYTVYGYWE